MADLRAWRSARARADDVPAYVVAHDALLAAIVEQRPGSIAALRRVKGMGPAKLDRYGDEILAILARH
jgi:superfamily II DNA helicase RecQ